MHTTGYDLKISGYFSVPLPYYLFMPTAIAYTNISDDHLHVRRSDCIGDIIP